jgi:hypothetical protein
MAVCSAELRLPLKQLSRYDISSPGCLMAFGFGCSSIIANRHLIHGDSHSSKIEEGNLALAERKEVLRALHGLPETPQKLL